MAGMEPRLPALGAQSLSHWTTRAVPFYQTSLTTSLEGSSEVGKADRNQVTLQASILDGKRKHWCLYTKSSHVVTSEDLFSLCPRQRGKSELRACGERFSSRELGMQVLIILVI